MAMTTPHRPLTADDLLARGPLRRLGRRVFIHDSIDSTNQFLLEHAGEVGDGAVASAELQTAGRGRLGRRWEAPRGSSVLLSVLLREPPDTPLTSLGALLAAVAACEAIEDTTDCSPGVRWPNDLVCGGRKLGGVLAESCVLPGATERAVVIGVGINGLQQRGHFRGALAQTATSLECECTQPLNRAALAAALLARLDRWLLVCRDQAGGWSAMRAAWRARCDDVGMRVTLEHDGRAFCGTAVEISDVGDLVVQLDEGGRRQFAATATTRVV
jgi:BirA family biotin operon repressor/biotin-[acetyl-CoA-carboxylase] ligase